ncbi:pentatricopeptide repeat-containing protein 2, mitochondrial-like [Hyposmocoma kahamanoa]|uniref:pentatricopeptide repeat-containing protein 2, mitochondrial-like n=1 Tax=Hyposmocoma kahamanoa TaxID=1477025 RepID=UPI000E6D8079|nr:pentatricopeptide repeat-containing protein 2, mitochondrial-like [Hyposmocoma kahamanoa]
MSFIVRTLIRNSLKYNIRTFTPLRTFHFTPVCCLYSPASLGVDGYLQSRKKTKEQFANFADKFRSKMKDFVADPKNMVFTEDLKNMVHMAEPTDLELVVNMIKKFNTQNTEFRFGSFVFGPVVMRMFHFLDAPTEALLCFNDPANSGFFDQLISYQILLDLLYNHQMYDEMFNVFEKIKERQINMTKFPKYPVVLIFAACYKQNTPKSFEYASKLWSEMASAGTSPLRRACTFFAALALKQGAPHIALESIPQQKQNYITMRNIKARALAEMGRADDALPVLRQVLEIDRPDQKDKHTFFEETVMMVREAVAKTNNKDLQKQFDDIENALKDRGLIDKQTLDQLVNSEITNLPKKQEQPRGVSFQKKMPFSHRRPHHRLYSE